MVFKDELVGFRMVMLGVCWFRLAEVEDRWLLKGRSLRLLGPGWQTFELVEFRLAEVCPCWVQHGSSWGLSSKERLVFDN